MNQERIRERQGTFNGHEHNHAGGHSNQMGLDASGAQLREYGDQPALIEGNLPDLFDIPDTHRGIEPQPRSGVIYEIGKRAMRRITRDGKR